MTNNWLDFSYLFTAPEAVADFRTSPEDFCVDETCDFTLQEQGEHLYLYIQKKGINTGWLSDQLAEYFGVRPFDVGYCGKKDRHAITQQWFSVYLPKGVSDEKIQQLADVIEGDITLKQFGWQVRKLRLGTHLHNRFQIRLRGVLPSDEVERRLVFIQTHGVPNYFGEQRFGRDANNLNLAKNWCEQGEQIRKRSLRSMVMSAARSYLFNRVLSERITQASWLTKIDGEALDVPSGPLWGRGTSLVLGEQLALESGVLADFSQWQDTLEHCGLNQERRPLALDVQGLQWQWQEDEKALTLSFALSPGGFATSVLRELYLLQNLSHIK